MIKKNPASLSLSLSLLSIEGTARFLLLFLETLELRRVERRSHINRKPNSRERDRDRDRDRERERRKRDSLSLFRRLTRRGARARRIPLAISSQKIEAWRCVCFFSLVDRLDSFKNSQAARAAADSRERVGHSRDDLRPMRRVQATPLTPLPHLRPAAFREWVWTVSRSREASPEGAFTESETGYETFDTSRQPLHRAHGSPLSLDEQLHRRDARRLVQGLDIENRRVRCLEPAVSERRRLSTIAPPKEPQIG